MENRLFTVLQPKRVTAKFSDYAALNAKARAVARVNTYYHLLRRFQKGGRTLAGITKIGKGLSQRIECIGDAACRVFGYLQRGTRTSSNDPRTKAHTIFDTLRTRDTSRTTFDDFSLSLSNISYRFEDMQSLARPMLQYLYADTRVEIALQRGTSRYNVICQVPRGKRGMSTLQGRYSG